MAQVTTLTVRRNKVSEGASPLVAATAYDYTFAKLIDGLNPAMQNSVLATGGKQYDVAQQGGAFTLRMTDGYKTLTHTQVLAQSVEVVRRRIDEMGTKEPTIERSGDDRILVQVPGLQDPGKLKEMLGKTPGNIAAIRPMKDGVISDFEMTGAMLSYFIRKVNGRGRLFGPQVVIAVPSGITRPPRSMWPSVFPCRSLTCRTSSVSVSRAYRELATPGTAFPATVP